MQTNSLAVHAHNEVEQHDYGHSSSNGLEVLDTFVEPTTSGFRP